MHYLDHAATTPVPAEVAQAMMDVLTTQFGNPSAQYPLGQEAKKLTDRCRATVAKALGCKPERLFFTSCGTESDNWAIQAALWQNRHLGKHIVTTAVELDEEYMNKIKETLETQTGRKLVLEFVIDPAIIGGIVLRVGDSVYDASLRAQLDNLRESIKRGE